MVQKIKESFKNSVRKVRVWQGRINIFMKVDLCVKSADFTDDISVKTKKRVGINYLKTASEGRWKSGQIFVYSYISTTLGATRNIKVDILKSLL